MKPWQIWIDTGGTFTDCIALDPEGQFHKTKVLSNSSLRGVILEWEDERSIKVDQNWKAPTDFVKGFSFSLLDSKPPPVKVASFDPGRSTLRLSREWTGPKDTGRSFEVVSEMEAPVTAARLITETKPGQSLPPVELRLATTKGTNALLERAGTPPVLFITAGFGDLLRIGDQKRPELFSFQIKKPEPLYRHVIEVAERMDTEGDPVIELDHDKLTNKIAKMQNSESGITSAAVCLMNGYKNPEHEVQIEAMLEKAGVSYISTSSRLNPFIKIISRAQTTVVNAYLSPVLREYLQSVAEEVPEGSLWIMTSAGGLETSDRFNPKDSLLSGPAGGVVGASATGRLAGFKRVVSFDMGGTSTDVARFDDGFNYEFEHVVGDAKLAAPVLSIETVAAGGGSICSYDGHKLTVGPDSAGADPGPACYGSGGPLTLTDVNLLLGRLEPDNFGIPVSPEAAKTKFRELLKQVGPNSPEELLEGFLSIANERMADAIRKISLRKGYDPSEYAIVAFGGAGGQHVCAIADLLDIEDIIVPSDAGLLSARGLGHAVVEKFAERQVLKSLSETEEHLASLIDDLEREASRKLQAEGVDSDEIIIRQKLAFMRLKGQESTVDAEFEEDSDLHALFKKAYMNRYGHWISGREVEVESIRVVASGQEPNLKQPEPDPTDKRGESLRIKKTVFDGNYLETSVYNRNELTTEQQIAGPALILDPYSTILVEPEWKAEVLADGSLKIARRQIRETAQDENYKSEAIALELFTNRFTSIAEEMGEMLRRTALSVNVKERLDFSCALLNAKGELVVNAPHIPVHLGALGLCIRRLKESIELKPGDVVATNHPAFGGSHLPDLTVVTPVFSNHDLVGFTASRAHHAEIGGTRPGSMPPDATTLVEEGVVIPPNHLVRQGKEQWGKIRDLLTSARYPTRSVEENIADLQAAVAANHRGANSLIQLIKSHGQERVLYYMNALKQHAADKIRTTIQSIQEGTYRSVEKLDDGTPLKVLIEVTDQRIVFDFEGTGGVHPGNLNATPAIVNSVIIYLLRMLVGESLPLNEGLLDPVTIRLPRCLLNPGFPDDPAACPAVVGGNVETSQRLVDLLLKPFKKIACSQGTMNNVLFGNERFGYYETIGGGTGAGPGFTGADAVHHHMTNTSGTDPEILEQRYPVRLERYAVRRDSGGAGKRSGGNGVEREMTFLEPVSLSVLTQHRVEAPYGLEGGKPGARGKQWIIRRNGTREELQSTDGAELEAGDRFVIQTPGGGGYGNVE